MIALVAHFGETLRTLYEVIGLTQRQLADAAGLSDAVINKAVSSPTCNIRRSTAIDLYRALRDRATRSRHVVPDELWKDFEALAKIPAAITLTAAQRETLTREHREATSAESRTDDGQRCHLLVDDLISQRGAASVLKLLEAALAFSEESSSEPRRIRVINPPVQKQGYVEQTITEYEPASDKESQTSSKPKARRAGG